MSLPIYQRVAVTDSGDVIPGAEYTVINENTGVAAPIYSDRTGATLLSAPYFADSVGTIQFFIAQGTTFRVAASGGVGTYTDRYVYGVAGAVLTDASGSVDNGGSNPLAISRDGGTDSNVSIRFKQLSSSWYAGANGSNAFGINTTADLTNSMLQITSDGNVGIGTSSPSAKIEIRNDVPASTDLDPTAIKLYNNLDGGSAIEFSNAVSGKSKISFGVQGGGGSTDDTYLGFSTSLNAGSLLERMRIDANGALGVNYTNPSALGTVTIKQTADSKGIAIIDSTGTNTLFLENDGTQCNIRNNSASPMVFTTNLAERMRIDSAGKLCVGTPNDNGAGAMNVVGSAAAGPLSIFQSTGAGDVNNAGIYIIKADANTTASQAFVAFVQAGSASGEIVANGPSAAAFAAWSDSRLKENIEDLPNQLSNITSLRAVEFDYKDGSGHQIGFIAQEMQEIYPDSVSEDTDTGMLKLSGWSKTEARFVKAIQEQQTIIEALTARIEALEAK